MQTELLLCLVRGVVGTWVSEWIGRDIIIASFDLCSSEFKAELPPVEWTIKMKSKSIQSRLGVIFHSNRKNSNRLCLIEFQRPVINVFPFIPFNSHHLRKSYVQLADGERIWCKGYYQNAIWSNRLLHSNKSTHSSIFNSFFFHPSFSFIANHFVYDTRKKNERNPHEMMIIYLCKWTDILIAVVCSIFHIFN